MRMVKIIVPTPIPQMRPQVGGSVMATPQNELKDRLTRYRQIKLSVIGRKSGRTITIPVWFVLEGEKLYLLPVQGFGHPEVHERPPEPVDSH